VYKKNIIICFLVLLAMQNTQAQGTITYLSNLGQTSTGSNPVANDSWAASGIVTGDNPSGYILNSVQLGMADASGNPSGFTVAVYSAVALIKINPGSSLGTLDGSANPSTAGTYTYADDSNLILLPGHGYFIVLTAGTAVANGAYQWSHTIPNAYNPTGGWSAGSIWQSSNGSTWTSTSGSPQFSVNATAIPEPSVWALILLGGGVFVYVRGRKLHFVGLSRRQTNGLKWQGGQSTARRTPGLATGSAHGVTRPTQKVC
jgi:hypothetical protein